MVIATPQSFIEWFAAPQLESAASTRRARSLWMIAWTFFGLVAVMLAAAIVATPATLERRGISILMVGVLVLVLHGLNRRGRTAIGSWVFVLGLTAIVTQRAWYTGGIHAPVALFYMMFVLIAAGLLGIRGTVVVALACITSATLLTGGELAGWLPPAARGGSTAAAFVAIALSLAVTVLCLTLLLRDAEQLAAEDLVHMFVHDMRSPLTVVMARLTMLRADVVDSTESLGHAEAAMAEAMRLNRMANSLLDITRLQNAHLRIHRSPTDLAQLARDVVRRMGAMDPSRRIEVDAGAPVVCECDQELLRRIIENLVSNALKHTPGGGHIIVRVISGEGSVRLSVHDEGPGIAKDARAGAFARYSARGTRARSGHHSAGLGLAFCKLAVAEHGGRIWIEDAEPHGSVFIVELPAHA